MTVPPSTAQTRQAASLLWNHWSESTRLDALPVECRPKTRLDGYAIQHEVARVSGQATAGWKIAATSAAGQRHIGVEGPLAGRLLAGRRREDGALVPLSRNLMRVAEAEFAFRLARALPPRSDPYSQPEVLDAVAALAPAIEVPDSRFNHFSRAGAPSLIADMACADWFIIGPDVDAGWRARDLADHSVRASRNGAPAGEGRGANVLGDPRAALTWIANELCTYGPGLRAGDVVITGTCVAPVTIVPGDRVEMDFGDFGSMTVSFS